MEELSWALKLYSLSLFQFMLHFIILLKDMTPQLSAPATTPDACCHTSLP